MIVVLEVAAGLLLALLVVVAASIAFQWGSQEPGAYGEPPNIGRGIRAVLWLAALLVGLGVLAYLLFT